LTHLIFLNDVTSCSRGQRNRIVRDETEIGSVAGLALWGAAHGGHAVLIRELGATPIDFERQDFTRAGDLNRRRRLAISKSSIADRGGIET
jgi:hypothetical protein